MDDVMGKIVEFRNKHKLNIKEFQIHAGLPANTYKQIRLRKKLHPATIKRLEDAFNRTPVGLGRDYRAHLVKKLVCLDMDVDQKLSCLGITYVTYMNWATGKILPPHKTQESIENLLEIARRGKNDDTNIR